MNKTELIKELRELTQAGMNDCKEALEQSGNDLQKAVDYIKTKGLNIADGRSGRVASEGRVEIFTPVALWDENKNRLPNKNMSAMIEINCQTDFVANSDTFIDFCQVMAATLAGSVLNNSTFEITGEVENLRKSVVAKTKENVVVRRWWAEEAFSPMARVFNYTHSNNKIGVLLTLLAPSVEAANSSEFTELGENLAMQVAAMNPLAVDAERLSAEDVSRQHAIFQQQLQDLKKPQTAWPKILEGKTRKWHTEVCLMEQEAIWVPKTTVKQVVANVTAALGGEIKVVNFVRCQVGEGVETKKDNLVEEVAKMM